MTAMEIDFISMNSRRVVVATGRCGTECFWLIVSVIDVAHVWGLRHRRGVVHWWAKKETKIRITVPIGRDFSLNGGFYF